MNTWQKLRDLKNITTTMSKTTIFSFTRIYTSKSALPRCQNDDVTAQDDVTDKKKHFTESFAY